MHKGFFTSLAVHSLLLNFFAEISWDLSKRFHYEAPHECKSTQKKTWQTREQIWREKVRTRLHVRTYQKQRVRKHYSRVTELDAVYDGFDSQINSAKSTMNYQFVVKNLWEPEISQRKYLVFPQKRN